MIENIIEGNVQFPEIISPNDKIVEESSKDTQKQ